MRIRPARVDDAMTIAAVHIASWQVTYQGLVPQGYLDSLDIDQRHSTWERILREADLPRAGALVAEIDERIVGFVHVCPTRDSDGDPSHVGEVTSIYLLPEAWGTGTGRQLMEAALERLEEAGFAQATLWVLDANQRARRFYEAGGWRTDGAVKHDDVKGFTLTEVRYRRRTT